MEHHDGVSINALPHVEACSYGELVLMRGANTHKKGAITEDQTLVVAGSRCCEPTRLPLSCSCLLFRNHCFTSQAQRMTSSDQSSHSVS